MSSLQLAVLVENEELWNKATIWAKQVKHPKSELVQMK